MPGSRASSTSSGKPARRAPAAKVYGFREARLFTPPLRTLNRSTSLGYEVADFADNVLGEPLLPWQRWAAIHAMELRPGTQDFRFRKVLILVARQNGKAIDCDVDILTANRGWTTIGDLVTGDEVFHPDGHPVRVTAAHPVRENRPCYRVTTSDYRSIVVDAEHLWTVQDKRRSKRKGPKRAHVQRSYEWETVTTAELLSRGLRRSEREFAYRLPPQRALISKPADLPIDPYLFGVWLGDGSSRAAAITVGDEDRAEITAAIENTGARIASVTPTNTAWHLRVSLNARHKYGFESRCRRLGVWGNKHIPDLYLTAGTEQRLALLQGLLDTDGSIYPGPSSARVEFCSVNRRLADGVLFLARSLGWRATSITARATINGRDCGPKYRVCFTPEQGEMPPFRLTRKLARVQAPQGRGTERHAVSIRSVEPAESRPVRCITVDRPDGLFLAGRDLVATHNSHLKRTVSLWRMFMDPRTQVLGVAQEVKLARKQWKFCQASIHEAPALDAEWGGVRNTNGDEYFWLANASEYAIGAASRRSGRGSSNDEVNIDELREQTSWNAWAALSKTTNARPNPQIWCMSNMGDDTSVVLNQLRDAGETGRDETLCVLEWSAPEGCELDDLTAWRHANPGLGYIMSPAAIRSDMGTDPPEIFRTEVLCQSVPNLNQAINAIAWRASADPGGTMDGLRDRIALTFDLAPDGQHATLLAAAKLSDGRVRVETVAAWKDSEEARIGLPAACEEVGPAAFTWMSSGPAAALATTCRALGRKYNHRHKRRDGDPPEDGAIGTKAVEACMELASVVKGRMILHPDDALLNAHMTGASKLVSGDGWRFTRVSKDGTVAHCDAAYACAGAVKTALEMPEPRRAAIRVLR